MFGRVGGGIGTQDRYSANAFLNFFNEGKRVSLFGNTGNGSRDGGGGQGLSMDMMGSGSSGILRNSTTAGINLNNPSWKERRDRFLLHEQ